MSLLRRLNRPELVFQPTAALKRLRHGRSLLGPAEVMLPWAQRITVTPDEIGRVIALTGVFDVCITEVIHRLLDPGDLAVDVGANMGYLTSLMATRVGPAGTVIAFEPHPRVFEVLERNVVRWQNDRTIGTIEARNLALSNTAGVGRLAVQPNFERHMGLASLRAAAESGGPNDVEVRLATLDELLGDREIALLKIDVEGHEHAVLQGAEALVAEGRVRDVVFEEHGVHPTPAMSFLESRGMTLLTLDHSLLGPRVHPVREGPAPPVWPGPNYLATRAPERAFARLRRAGWRSLARRRSRRGGS
jgi:FkbM family methyltransferase